MNDATRRRRAPGWLHLVAAGLGLSLALALAAGPAVALTLLPTPDTHTMSHDRVAVVPAPGVLGNDVGIGGNTHAILDSGPSHGVVVLAQNGGYTYTPAASYVGTDVFRYHPTGCLLGCLDDGHDHDPQRDAGCRGRWVHGHRRRDQVGRGPGRARERQRRRWRCAHGDARHGRRPTAASAWRPAVPSRTRRAPAIAAPTRSRIGQGMDSRRPGLPRSR